jgi:hypothetical protein
MGCMVVNRLHQVKDMDQVIETGRAVRQYVTQKSIKFIIHAKYFIGGNLGA